MIARDRLIELFQNGGPHHAFSIEETVDIELDAYAHELAEKIRRADPEKMSYEYGSSWWDAADFIDPEVNSVD